MADTVTMPEIGQRWRDGLSQGYELEVENVLKFVPKVQLRYFKDGERMEAVLSWPLDRWGALVEKQKMELVG
jgi:hypothetical protein